VTVLLVLAVFLLGVWVGGHPRQSGLERLPEAFVDRFVDEDRTALPTQVLAILERDYYKPIDRTAANRVEDLSVETLVKELGDPYTEYLNPDEYAAFKDQRAGVFAGIGITWQPVEKRATVVTVQTGGPAGKAGLRAQDVVVSVDGTPVVATDDFAAMQTVRGEEGTSVTLRIARPGAAEKDYTMTRAEIRERVVTSRVETVGETKVGYVRLDRFTSESGKTFAAEVRKLVTGSKVAGVVIDLRHDPGGLVSEAVKVASVFLPEDALIATQQARGGETERLIATGGAISASLPVVLVVDEASASASEIVAGALKDAGRAKLVGTRTFGKALIQTTRPLANGGAIKFTTASYLTPTGFDLGAKGLPPDVAVTDDPATPADEALQKALQQVTAR
jgi:carboxyl-terminal processing protease